MKNDFTKSEVDEAIEKTIIEVAGNIDRDYSEINRETIVIHGIHQFTPIMLRTIEILSKYKNVVILFNYQPDYKNVYQTWLNVYSWFESKISLSAQNFNNESQEFEGGVIADNIAAMIAGSTSAIVYQTRLMLQNLITKQNLQDILPKDLKKLQKKEKQMDLSIQHYIIWMSRYILLIAVLMKSLKFIFLSNLEKESFWIIHWGISL